MMAGFRRRPSVRTQSGGAGIGGMAVKVNSQAAGWLVGGRRAAGLLWCMAAVAAFHGVLRNSFSRPTCSFYPTT